MTTPVTATVAGFTVRPDIRPMIRSDIPQAADVLQSCHRRPDGTLPHRYETSAVSAMFRESLRSGCPHRARVLVAVEGKMLLGVVAFRASFFAAPGWELGYWATMPLLQGRGIGGMLLDAALDAIQGTAERNVDFVIVRTARPAPFVRRGFRRLPNDPAILMADVRSLRLSSEADRPIKTEAA